MIVIYSGKTTKTIFFFIIPFFTKKKSHTAKSNNQAETSIRVPSIIHGKLTQAIETTKTS